MSFGVQSLPPKMAQQFADRAKAGEGWRIGDQCYSFAQGNNVVSLVSLDPPVGHVMRSPHEADEIRRKIAEMESAK